MALEPSNCSPPGVGRGGGTPHNGKYGKRVLISDVIYIKRLRDFTTCSI